MNSVSSTTTTFWASTTNQNIIPLALKHFIKQQQQLEGSWVRRAAAFFWSAESCRVCAHKGERDAGATWWFDSQTNAKGLLHEHTELLGNQILFLIDYRMKLRWVTLGVKRKTWEIKGQYNKMSLGTQEKTQPLGMGNMTLSVVQEWFDLISQYLNWYYAEVTAKLGLTHYPTY